MQQQRVAGDAVKQQKRCLSYAEYCIIKKSQLSVVKGTEGVVIISIYHGCYMEEVDHMQLPSLSRDCLGC